MSELIDTNITNPTENGPENKVERELQKRLADCKEAVTKVVFMLNCEISKDSQSPLAVLSYRRLATDGSNQTAVFAISYEENGVKYKLPIEIEFNIEPDNQSDLASENKEAQIKKNILAKDEEGIKTPKKVEITKGILPEDEKGIRILIEAAVALFKASAHFNGVPAQKPITIEPGKYLEILEKEKKSGEESGKEK